MSSSRLFRDRKNLFFAFFFFAACSSSAVKVTRVAVHFKTDYHASKTTKVHTLGLGDSWGKKEKEK